MVQSSSVVASGNLATKRRTVTGVLGQLVLLDIGPDAARHTFTDAGLPARALEEPDFPISLEQELAICMSLVRQLPADRSAVRSVFGKLDGMGIENLGVLGMAMRHAANALEALKVCMQFPQLTWGHCRMVVRHQADAAVFSFQMDRPEIRDSSEDDIDRLVEYCLALDLASSLRNIEDIVDSRAPPVAITFPFAEPADWTDIAATLPFRVSFSQDEARLTYPAAFDDTPLPRANPLVHRSFVVLAEKLSQMLVEDVSLGERVTRLLWAYTPPPRRGEVASQLAMSERSLTRQLGKEGTSFAALSAAVQEERAKNFLRNQNLSVAEVGYRLGYSEPAAFTRAFSSWTGKSPLKWRQGLLAS